MWLPLAAYLDPWVEHFRAPQQEPDAWMNPPSGLRLLTASPSGARSVVLLFKADPRALEVLVDCRDAPLNPLGWHAARVWLRVLPHSNQAEVNTGEYTVGWTESPIGYAEALPSDKGVPTGILEVRVVGDEPSIGRFECFVSRDSA